MRIVFVTCPHAKSALELLRTLVDERLVAGGNVVPGVRSIYRWKDTVCDEPEAMVWMETAASKVDALMARIVALHPYETPKIVTFTPSEAHPAYAAWVRAETEG